MWVLMVEALVALSLLVFIVWWTMYADRPKRHDGVPPDHVNDTSATEGYLQRMQDGPGQPAPAAQKDGHGHHSQGNGQSHHSQGNGHGHNHGDGHGYGHSHSDSHDGGSSDGGGSSD